MLLLLQIAPIDPTAYADAAARAPVSDTSTLIAFCALVAWGLVATGAYFRESSKGTDRLLSVIKDQTKDGKDTIKALGALGTAVGKLPDRLVPAIEANTEQVEGLALRVETIERMLEIRHVAGSSSRAAPVAGNGYDGAK